MITTVLLAITVAASLGSVVCAVRARRAARRAEAAARGTVVHHHFDAPSPDAVRRQVDAALGEVARAVSRRPQ